MKASPKLTYAIAITALATSLPTWSPAQNAPPPPVSYVPSPSLPEMDLAQGVYLASIDAEDRSLRRYAGQRLYNTEGADLGSVRDFIVQPATSQVRYAVVSTGGVFGGMGNSLRLVPVEVIRRGPRGNMFEVDILQFNWLQIPPVNDRDYVVDRFVISPTLHREMVQRYRSVGPLAVNPAGNEAFGLVRASVLRGKSIEVANRKVGEVENIILDLERGTAAALLDAAGEFTGTRAKYLVPLSRLAFADPRKNPISTNLTRRDFDGARPSFFGPRETAVPYPTRTPQEPPLTPTGPMVVPVPPHPLPASQPPVTYAPPSPSPQPVTVAQAPAPPVPAQEETVAPVAAPPPPVRVFEAPAPPAPAQEETVTQVAAPPPPVSVSEAPTPPAPAKEVAVTPALASGPSANALPNELVQDARAIRRAIDLDPELVAENVQVTPDNGKVYLRGNVRNQATRLALEIVAQRVVSTSPIENQITVGNP